MRTSSNLTFIVLTWAAVILASCAPEVAAQSPPSPMCAGTPMEGALADVDADDACNRRSSRDACGPVKTSVETDDSLQCDLCWRLYVKERRWDPAEGRRLTVCSWGSMLTATKTKPKTLALAGTCKWVERPALPGTWGYSPPTPGLCAPAGDGTEACVGTCDPAKLDPSKACAKVPIRSKCEPQIIP